MNIANRSMVARQIAIRFGDCVLYECNDSTPAFDYVNMMSDVLDERQSVIIENGWRAEYVLGAMGQPTKIPIPVKRMLDRIALGCSAKIAYCYADTRTYAENVNKISSYDKMKDLIVQMHEQWEWLISAQNLSVTKINTSDPGFILDLDLLEDQVKIFNELNLGPGIGRWKISGVVLLVGDKHGPSLQPYQVNSNIAFCDMAKVGSSFWLSQKLDEANIPEDRLYWINSYDKSNLPTNSEFVHKLNPITILALGDVAAGWCEKNQLRYEPFSHPQYHKRFKFSDPYPLIERLKELCAP